MSETRVKIEIEEREFTKDGVPGFFLTVRVFEPEKFPEYLANSTPENCFVYQLPDINFVQDVTFLRVANISDIKELPTTYEKSGDVYRSNIYSKFFTTIEELLAAEEILLRDIRALYSDIRTLFTYIQTTKRKNTYVLPDYVEDTIKTLIESLLAKRRLVTELSTKYSIINDVILPFLETKIASLEQQSEEISKHLNEIKAQKSLKWNIDLNTFTSVLEELDTIFKNLNENIEDLNIKAGPVIFETTLFGYLINTIDTLIRKGNLGLEDTTIIHQLNF